MKDEATDKDETKIKYQNILRKHNLNDENKSSFKISNVYARNNNASELKRNKHFEDFKIFKLNYKFYVICKSLILNLCDYLRTTHLLIER